MPNNFAPLLSNQLVCLSVGRSVCLSKFPNFTFMLLSEHMTVKSNQLLPSLSHILRRSLVTIATPAWVPIARGVQRGGLRRQNYTWPDTDPGVTSEHTTPPKILTAPHYFEAPRIIEKCLFFMLIFNAHVYLVNHYYLTAPGKFLITQGKMRN